MRQSPTSLEQLFDRTWRPGHPFRPRVSATRRWGMFGILLVLLTLIGGYWYVTDSIRVKHMCESYLQDHLIGGRVEVGQASLSIFEGLRLEKVRVLVDDGRRPDSTLFEIGSVSLKYNPISILSGKLQVTEIVAIDPVVRLCEDAEIRTSVELPAACFAATAGQQRRPIRPRRRRCRRSSYATG